jgi:putative transposase
MGNYHRNYQSGGIFFFTVVTERRRSFLTKASCRQLLRNSICDVRLAHPFDILAIVLLPDHLHSIWKMPEDQPDYSLRWRRIKETFTKSFLAYGGKEAPISDSRRRRGQRGVWQPRFWEHTCRDEHDLKRCVDYIHWNPVKHGLVEDVTEYPFSSFHRYLRAGEYAWDWGKSNPCEGMELPE